MNQSIALCEPIEFEGDDPTALYRLYDAQASLLYVGITLAPATRMYAHSKTQSWWPEVARKTMVWYPSRLSACEAEETAIKDEHPKYNIKLKTASSVKLNREKNLELLRQEFEDAQAAAYMAGEYIRIGNTLGVQKITGENWASISKS